MGIAEFDALGWSAARGPLASATGPVLGTSLGSGYQAYFSTLSTSAQKTEIARMKAAGLTWVRIDVNWNTVQQSSGGTYVFTYPNIAAQALLNNGMNVVALLNESPKWARAVGANPGVPGCPFPTFSPSDYAAFCGAAAKYLGPMGIQVFEVWNEPNLDSGYGSTDAADYNASDPDVYTTPLGLGVYSPVGYAALATAAYETIHAQFVPPTGSSTVPVVLGGALGIHHSLASTDASNSSDPTVRPNASWSSYTAGQTSVVVGCTAAKAADQYALISSADNVWPAGTYVSSVTPGVSLTLAPPVWSTTGFPAISAAGGQSLRADFGYPADTFLSAAYATAAGAPMFDALSTHPYAFPELPATQSPLSGGWNLTPAVREVMVANGDGAKPIWFTELGAPTGAPVASWAAVSATATSLAATGFAATPADAGYLASGPGLPPGAYVGAATADSGWVLLPPTGLTVDPSANTLTPGAPLTDIYVQVKSAVVIKQGTELTVCLGSPSAGMTVTVTGSAASDYTLSATSAASPARLTFTNAVTLPQLPTGTVPPLAFTGGGPVLIVSATGLGLPWGTAIPAATNASLHLLAPGVDNAGGLCTEPQQSSILQQALNHIVSGSTGANGEYATPAWPYVAAVFVYCWSDASLGTNAGSYGLTRVDGTAKTALTVLTAF
jgi:hypothetical protein